MSKKSLDVLLQYVDPISQQLEAVLNKLRLEFPSGLSRQGEWALSELIDYAKRPSKRLRGSLAALTYDKFSGQAMSQPGLLLGVVLELLQNYLLIVDDVMDQSPLRRGQPTVQILYRSAYPDASDHEADMVAVNVGLLAQHLASMVLSEIEEDPANLRLVGRVIHRNIATTGLGQIDDLYEQISRKVSASDIERKHLLKSAYYTFINPLQAGLALAGVADEKDAAVAYGAPAGTAFQVHDDYLGVFGDGGDTGKANLDDIREGKYTFMVQHALENAETSDIAVLTRILGNPKASLADLMTVREIFESTGAVQANRKLEKASAETAKKAVDDSELWPAEVAEVLKSLVDYSIERTK